MGKQIKATLANAMVALVHEEFLQQLQQYPATTLQQIDLSDAIAYALNQLPPLYTTKEEDWESYKNEARQQISFSIKKAVETGIKVSQIQRKENRQTPPVSPQGGKAIGITTAFTDFSQNPD